MPDDLEPMDSCYPRSPYDDAYWSFHDETETENENNTMNETDSYTHFIKIMSPLMSECARVLAIIKDIDPDASLPSPAFSFEHNYATNVTTAKGSITIFQNKPEFLAKFGEAYGKDGWTRKPSYETYHWVRTHNGVTVQIYRAEKVDVKTDSVLPSAWPLLLENGDAVIEAEK